MSDLSRWTGPLGLGSFRFRLPAVLRPFEGLSRSEFQEHLRTLSVEELEEIRDSDPSVRWEELTDHELHAIADGGPIPPGALR